MLAEHFSYFVSENLKEKVNQLELSHTYKMPRGNTNVVKKKTKTTI